MMRQLEREKVVSGEVDACCRLTRSCLQMKVVEEEAAEECGSR